MLHFEVLTHIFYQEMPLDLNQNVAKLSNPRNTETLYVKQPTNLFVAWEWLCTLLWIDLITLSQDHKTYESDTRKDLINSQPFHILQRIQSPSRSR